ncbi:MAG: hydrogen gas-evolving membrane-bound hydrogenase subunit E, partial [Actinomycetota bacterium]
RLAVAGLVGLGVMVGLAAASSAPTGSAPFGELIERSADEGGGNNVVNVILTDVRALDTLGEIIVLAVVAVGVVSLARAGRSSDDESVTLPDEGAADLLPRDEPALAHAGTSSGAGSATGAGSTISEEPT